MAQKRGDQLTLDDQVLAVLKFAQDPTKHNSDWLGRHLFHVNGKGRFDKRARFCYPIATLETLLKPNS